MNSILAVQRIIFERYGKTVTLKEAYQIAKKIIKTGVIPNEFR